MNTKKLLSSILIFFLFSSVLSFAGNDVTIRAGTYKFAGLSGKGKLVIYQANGRWAYLYDNAGPLSKGRWQIKGDILIIDFSESNQGYITVQTFVIINNETFVNQLDGCEWFRIGPP
jgi:hypothetical protein